MNDKATSWGVEYEKLGLRTLGDTKFEQRFDTALQGLIEDLHDDNAVQKKGVVTGEITLKFKLQYTIDTKAVHIGSGFKVSSPDRKGGLQAGITRGHTEVMVPIEYDDGDEQTGMFDRSSTKH